MKKLSFVTCLLTAGFCIANALSATPSVSDRVRSDMAANDAKKISDQFAYYVVPPMSNVKRLETTYPEDGVFGGPIRIIAAQKEFEPASVEFFGLADAKEVTLKVSDLKGKNGTIPASFVDSRPLKRVFLL